MCNIWKTHICDNQNTCFIKKHEYKCVKKSKFLFYSHLSLSKDMGQREKGNDSKQQNQPSVDGGGGLDGGD